MGLLKLIIADDEKTARESLRRALSRKYLIIEAKDGQQAYNLIKKEGLPHSPKFTISLNALNFKDIRADGDSIREAQKNAAKKLLNLFYEK